MVQWWAISELWRRMLHDSKMHRRHSSSNQWTKPAICWLSQTSCHLPLHTHTHTHVTILTTVFISACITLPIRFLRSGDRRRNRKLTGSMTMQTVLAVRVFFASEQKFRTVRLTVETVGGDRTRPYALTVSGRWCGFYGQLLRSLRSVRLAATVCTVSTVSCYGLAWPWRLHIVFSIRRINISAMPAKKKKPRFGVTVRDWP